MLQAATPSPENGFYHALAGGMLERDRRSGYQDGGRQRWSYNCQPCLVRFTANAVTYMSSLTSASILKVPVPY